MADEGSSGGDPYLIVVVGNASVGKTTLILKFSDNKYNVEGENRDQTLNVDFKTVERVYGGNEVKMQVWDTVGDKYKGSTSFIVKKPTVGAYILAFNLGDQESFEDIFKTWEGKLPDDKVRVLVGTHSDEPQVVTDEQVEQRLKTCGSQYCTNPKYFKVSSKTGENLEPLFEAIMQVLLKRKKGRASGVVNLSAGGGDARKKDCKC